MVWLSGSLRGLLGWDLQNGEFNRLIVGLQAVGSALNKPVRYACNQGLGMILASIAHALPLEPLCSLISTLVRSESFAVENALFFVMLPSLEQ